LTEEGKEVPKVKLTLEEMESSRIDTLLTELPYETLIKYFSFVWKNHPSNKSIQEDITQVLLQNCVLHRGTSKELKDMKVRLKQDLLDKNKDLDKTESQNLKEIHELVR
jgi:hypothetical protein